MLILGQAPRHCWSTDVVTLACVSDHSLVQDLLDELAASRMDDEAWNEKLELLEEYVEDHGRGRGGGHLRHGTSTFQCGTGSETCAALADSKAEEMEIVSA